MSNYNQLSDYNSTEEYVKNEAANAPITFEKIVMVVITCSNLITLLFRGFKIF